MAEMPPARMAARTKRQKYATPPRSSTESRGGSAETKIKTLPAKKTKSTSSWSRLTQPAVCSDHGEKTGVADVDGQLPEIGEVDGAGNLLRSKAVVKVRAQTGREGYSGEQGKDQIDGIDPNHTGPVAQDKLKSLGKKVGQRALHLKLWLP